MIVQTLLFKFKPEVTQENIVKMKAEYKGLMETTPLFNVEVGPNISTEGFDQGFTHMAIAGFMTRDDVNSFLAHPDHLAFADNTLNPMLSDFILLEIEI